MVEEENHLKSPNESALPINRDRGFFSQLFNEAVRLLQPRVTSRNFEKLQKNYFIRVLSDCGVQTIFPCKSSSPCLRLAASISNTAEI